MLVAAGVLGTIGAIIKVANTVAVARESRRDPSEPVALLVNAGAFYNTFIGTALGLTAGGMARRGRMDAHAELFEGRPATRKRRFALGWGLLGGGVGLWGITRIIGGTSCGTQVCTARVWETGYYLSLGATVPGSIMAGYATGFRRYRKRFGHLAAVKVAPIAHRDAWGLSLSGRF
ncbi:MAG: hypothetical protein AB1Z98_07190 [Nannocystaceae bacterium]